jgi:hypothetical protein
MANFALLRTAGILTVGLAHGFISDKMLWKFFVYSIALSHYTAALFYSRKQLIQVFSRADLLIRASAASALGLGLILLKFPLIIYFAIHHVFDTVFLPQQTFSAEKKRTLRSLRISGVLLHLFIYCFILRDHNFIEKLSAPFIVAGLLASIGYYGFMLRRSWPLLTKGERRDSCFFEATGLIFCVLSLFTRIYFLDVVLFHVLFWTFYPLSNILNQSRANNRVISAAVFLLLSVGLGFVLFFGQQIKTGSPFLTARNFVNIFEWTSYLHITFSFFLSNSQPDWIIRWFRPFPIVPRAVALAEPPIIESVTKEGYTLKR